MTWAALSLAALSLVVAIAAYLLNRRAISDEKRDRKTQLKLLDEQVKAVADRQTRDLIGAGEVVCRELVDAAFLAERFYALEYHMNNVVERLGRDGWRQHHRELAGLFHGRETPWLVLWKETQDVEAALDATKTRAAEPPEPEALRGLAVRLDDAVRRLASGDSD